MCVCVCVCVCINATNESTKVQNPRQMCGLASDGIMTNCTVQLYYYQTMLTTCTLLNHKLILLPSHLGAQIITLRGISQQMTAR